MKTIKLKKEILISLILLLGLLNFVQAEEEVVFVKKRKK